MKVTYLERKRPSEEVLGAKRVPKETRARLLLQLKVAIKEENSVSSKSIMTALYDDGHMTFDELYRYVKLCTQQVKEEST